MSVVASVLSLLMAITVFPQVDGGSEGGAECPDCGNVSFVPAPGGDVRPLVGGGSGGGILVCALDPRGCDGSTSGAVGVVEVNPGAGASSGGAGTASSGGAVAGGGGGSAGSGSSPALPPPPTCTPVASRPTAANIGHASLPSGDLGHDPYVRGLTGLHTGVWYEGPTDPVSWVQAGTLGVRSNCSTYRSVFGGYAAAPTEYRWHFDEDGVVLSSANPGTPQQWAAQHLYNSKGNYTLAVQVRWGVVASPGGGGGTRSVWAYADHPVIEVRSALLPG